MEKLDIEKSFIENSDYLKQLALELESRDISEIDSNLLYEVAYADTYLGMLQLNDSSKSLNKEISEIKHVFENILDSVDYNMVSKVKKKLDYRKLIKCRYDKVEDASYDKSYATSQDCIVTGYLKDRLPKMMSLVVALAIVKILPCAMIELMVKDLNNGADADLVNSSTVDAYLKTLHTVPTFINLIITLMFGVYILGLSLDLLYICLPSLRELLERKKDNFISNEAVKAVEICMDTEVTYKTVKDYDRIERNKAWLRVMQDNIEYIRNVNRKEGDALAEEIINIGANIERFENDDKRKKEYYLCISKIEFLHDIYLKLYDMYLSPQ